MSEFVRSIDLRFYDQPGFSDLQYAWERVFDYREGVPTLDPEQVITLLQDVRLNARLEFGYNSDELDQLESIACKYARESVASLSFEMEEL